MKFLRSINNAFSYVGDNLQSLFLLCIRLFWGYGFFLSGLGKFGNIDKVIGFFTNLGIPYPEINAYAAAGVELVGGALLILGLFSRIAAIPLIFTMGVAYLTAHKEALLNIFNDTDTFFQQAPFLFLLAALIVFVFGPGRFSLDYFLFDKDKR